jgi:imidazolonepropionase-like amidohydrolase
VRAVLGSSADGGPAVVDEVLRGKAQEAERPGLTPAADAPERTNGLVAGWARAENAGMTPRAPRRLAFAALPCLALAALLPASAGAEDPPPVLALVGARLLDGTGAAPVSDAVVLVRGGRVQAVGPAAQVRVPEGARRIDLHGATLLPGLVNAHVHVGYDAEQLRRFARAGVTTVRDLSARDPVSFRARTDALNADPRNATVIAATPILTVSDGYGHAYADTPEAMRALVAAYADRGADLVKTSLEMDLQGRQWELPAPEISAALVETAHARGKKVSVHVTRSFLLERAVELGVDDVAHGVVNPVDDTLLAKLVARGIAWEPTLELWKCVNAKYGNGWDKAAAENLGRFHRAGGVVAMGSDFAGYDCEWDRDLPLAELLAMQAAGLSPMEVIVASTRNAARVSDREKDLGTIAAGKQADLLAVRGDPLQDLRALAAPVLVVHRGVVIREEGGGGEP